MSMSGGPSLGTATYYITGNAQGAINAATQANNALAQMGQTVANNWWGLQNLGTAFAALPAAVATGVGYAIKATVAWQDAMFAVERTSGETGKNLDKIEQDILDVAKTIPLATTELAELAASGAQLGVANDQLANFAKTMGIFISATDVGQQGVADFARVSNVMQLAPDEMERLATVVLEVGRNTAATESEILNISKRMSGAAATAGFTADQLVGLGAAVISLGPRAEAGGTALNKTIADMTRAISQGGEELALFARVAGMSSGQFAQAFREDAASALAAFMTGLARLKGGGEEAYQVLDALGITEARQSQALLQLANGTKDVGNEQRDLNTILAQSQHYWTESNALNDIAEARAKTLSGQLQLLKNSMFELGTIVGNVLVGPLGWMIQRFGDFIAGIQAIPLPLQILMGLLMTFLTVLTGLGAAFLLIGPRIFIARDAMRSLFGGTQQLTPAIINLGLQLNRTAASAGVMGAALQNASRQAIIAANNAAIASGAQAAGYQSMQSNLAGLSGMLATGTQQTSRFSGVLRGLTKAAGWATAAMTVLSIATVFLGNRQRDAEKQAQKALEANSDLVSIMRQQGETVGPASLEWVKATDRYKVAASAAQQLGLDLAILDAVITGMATPDQFDVLLTTIKKNGKAGKDLGKVVRELATIYENSANRAGVHRSAVESTADAQQEAAEETRKNTEALREQAEELERIAQGHIDLADAMQSQQTAQIALSEAQANYRKAALGGTALELQKAELELAQARYEHAKAVQDLSDREEELTTARRRGRDRAREAQLDLADANDRYANSLENIQRLEEELAELRLGPSADQMRDAINDLRNAELKLARAHQTVADAEWYLQHLREEGASDRDIADAEMALAEARQNVADSEDDLIDATEELNDLRDTVKQQQKIAEAERDLQRAYRDSERAGRDVQERERALADARERVAKDLDYRDAQKAIVDAQLRVQDALRATREAEIDLERIRAGRAQSDALRAARELETAIIDMAEANVAIRRAQAEANGEVWDAGDAAHALADELSGLLHLAPDAATAKRLQDYINTLYAAPNVPDVPKDSGLGDTFDPEDYGMPPLDGVQKYIEDLNDLLDDAGGGDGKSFWDKIWEGIGGGAGAGGLVGGGIGALVGGPAGAIVGALIGSIIGGLVEKFWPEISGFFSGIGEMLGRNLPQWFKNVTGFFSRLPGQIGGALSGLGRAIGGAFSGGLQAIGGFVSEAGSTLMGFFSNLPYNIGFAIGTLVGTITRVFINVFTGIWNTISTWGPRVLEWFRNLPSNIWGFVSGLPGTLWGIFSSAGSSMWNGVIHYGGNLLTWFRNLPSNIWNGLSNLGSDLWRLFENAGRNMWNGIVGWLDRLLNFFLDLPGRIGDALSGLPGQLWNGARNMGAGLWNGFWGAVSGSPYTKIEYALWTMEDNAEKVLSNMRNTMKGLNNLTVDPFAGAMERGFASAGLSTDYLSGLLNDMRGGRIDFAASIPGIGSAQGSVTYVNETLNLEAITTADPKQIVNEYVWAKRIRTRGGTV